MHPSNPSPENSNHTPSPAPEATPPEPAAAAPPEEELKPVPPTEAQEEDADRRISPRRKKLLRVMVENPLSGRLPFIGWLVDRSIGGMCLSVDHEIEPGSVLQIRRPSAPPGTPWVEVRVLNMRQSENTWELGCEYVRTPTWEVMQQFE